MKLNRSGSRYREVMRENRHQVSNTTNEKLVERWEGTMPSGQTVHVDIIEVRPGAYVYRRYLFTGKTRKALEVPKHDPRSPLDRVRSEAHANGSYPLAGGASGWRMISR